MAMSSRSPNSRPYSTHRMMYGRSWGRRSRGEVLKERLVSGYATLSAASAHAIVRVHQGRAVETRASRRRYFPVLGTRAGDTRLLVPGDEPFESLAGGVVRPLLGRGLHQIGTGREQRALDPAVEGQLAGANGVDDHPRRVGRVPDLELELEVDRLVAEPATLQADVRPVAVGQPRHVVARADVDGLRGQVVAQL